MNARPAATSAAPATSTAATPVVPPRRSAPRTTTAAPRAARKPPTAPATTSPQPPGCQASIAKPTPRPAAVATAAATTTARAERPATKIPAAAPSPALTPIQYQAPIARQRNGDGPSTVPSGHEQRTPPARLLHVEALGPRPADGEPPRPHRPQGARDDPGEEGRCRRTAGSRGEVPRLAGPVARARDRQARRRAARRPCDRAQDRSAARAERRRSCCLDRDELRRRRRSVVDTDHLVAPALLRAVERLVCLVRERLRSRPVRRVRRDADRDRRAERLARRLLVHAPRLDRSADPLGDLQRGLLIGAGDDDRELLAAEAGSDVAVAKLSTDRLGKRTQNRIAREMAVRVVEAPEVVEIEHEKGERRSPAGRALELVQQCSLELPCVEQTGLRVDPRLDLELRNVQRAVDEHERRDGECDSPCVGEPDDRHADAERGEREIGREALDGEELRVAHADARSETDHHRE